MKIETIKQTEETVIVIENELEIEIRTVKGNTAMYIHLIPYHSDHTYLDVTDWEGNHHEILLEHVSPVIVDYLLSGVSSKPIQP